MQIVIEIDEEVIEHAKEMTEGSIDEYKAIRAIANGTPLPKGHGRLIDADELLKAMDTWDKFGVDANTKIIPVKNCYVPYVHYDDMIQAVKGMPTIIEADTPKRRKGTPLEENDSGYNCENWIP